MKKIVLGACLLMSTTLFAQKETKVKNDTVIKAQDTLVVVTFKLKEFQAFDNWLDNLNAPHQEVKAIQKLVYDRLKLVKQ